VILSPKLTIPAPPGIGIGAKGAVLLVEDVDVLLEDVLLVELLLVELLVDVLVELLLVLVLVDVLAGVDVVDVLTVQGHPTMLLHSQSTI